MEGIKINTDFYSAEYKDGGWIYKANSSVPFKKGAGYSDKPRYPVIFKYEGEFKNKYDDMLKDMNRSVLDKIKSFSK